MHIFTSSLFQPLAETVLLPLHGKSGTEVYILETPQFVRIPNVVPHVKITS
jgi:hypothetical protein